MSTALCQMPVKNPDTELPMPEKNPAMAPPKLDSKLPTYENAEPMALTMPITTLPIAENAGAKKSYTPTAIVFISRHTNCSGNVSRSNATLRYLNTVELCAHSLNAAVMSSK